jgi:hypothetical protein
MVKVSNVVYNVFFVVFFHEKEIKYFLMKKRKRFSQVKKEIKYFLMKKRKRFFSSKKRNKFFS